MSNIVERLRDGAEILLLERGGILEHTTLTEAADEIERLRNLLSGRARFTEVERLRAELATLKALLRESVREAFDDAYVLHPEGIDLLNRIRAVLGENQ